MLETGDVLPRQIEDAPDIGFFLRRHDEDAAEDFEFLFGDDAIGLGHFAGQRDDGDGEGDARIAVAVQEEMAGDRAHQSAHGAGDK